MPAKAQDEVRFTPEPSPATAYGEKLKSIVVYTTNEQGMSSIQRKTLTSEKAIFRLQTVQRISWTS